jgi:hypothetical protein
MRKALAPVDGCRLFFPNLVAWQAAVGLGPSPGQFFNKERPRKDEFHESPSIDRFLSRLRDFQCPEKEQSPVRMTFSS